MAFPQASGTPALSGITIPQLWAKKLLVYFYPATWLTDITQTDYVSEIKNYGDTITVAQFPEMKINNYVNGQDLNIDRPSPGKVMMNIDKAKYFCYAIPDVDVKQSIVQYVSQWADHSAKQMVQAIERDFLAGIYTDASAYNKGATAGKESGNINLGASGSPLAVSSSTVLTMILGAGQCLDEQNVPKEDRYIIIPPWMEVALKASDLKQAYLTGDSQSTYRTGVVGAVDKMKIYTSNLLTKGLDGSDAVWHVLAGQKVGAAFAYQLTKNETIRNPNGFEDLQRGLMVYGWKGIKPEALVDIYVKKG